MNPMEPKTVKNLENKTGYYGSIGTVVRRQNPVVSRSYDMCCVL